MNKDKSFFIATTLQNTAESFKAGACSLDRLVKSVEWAKEAPEMEVYRPMLIRMVGGLEQANAAILANEQLSKASEAAINKSLIQIFEIYHLIKDGLNNSPSE